MSIEVIAAGCTFPAGPSLTLADIAVRTQLALIRNHPTYLDHHGMPAKVSYFPQHELSFDINRWQIMADQALQDALRHITAYAGLPTRLWIILPLAQKPGIPYLLESAMETSLMVRLPECKDVTVLRGSHAEAGNALVQIEEKQLKDTIFTLDIIVAVESWLAQESMAWLEERGLLHNSHHLYNTKVRRNPYGRIPGEGAAVVILARESKIKGWSILSGAAIEKERVLREDETPCLGLGLTQAAHRAISAAGLPVISHIVTDFNGEPYRADEYGFTVSRLKNSLRDNFIRSVPVLASGDIGCASLVMHIAQTAWQLKQTVAAEENNAVLILASSDDSQRCAVVMGQINQGKN